MLEKQELEKIIVLLKDQCELIITNDPSTNTLTYDQWLDSTLEKINGKVVSEWDKEN